MLGSWTEHLTLTPHCKQIVVILEVDQANVTHPQHRMDIV